MNPEMSNRQNHSGKAVWKIFLVILTLLGLIVIVKQRLDELGGKDRQVKAQVQKLKELRAHEQQPEEKPPSMLDVRFYVVNGPLSKAELSLESRDDLSCRLTLPTRETLNQYGRIQKENRLVTLEPDAEMFLDVFFLEGDQLDLIVTQAGKETRYEDVRKGTYALLLTHDYWVKWKSIQYSSSGKDLLPRFASTRRFDYNGLGRGLYVIDPEKIRHLIFSKENPPARQKVQFSSPIPQTYYIQVFRSPFHK